MKLVQVSDLHFGDENLAATTAALTRIRREAPDLVIVAGDLTLDGRTAEFDAAARWIAQLPGPRLVTPGNHDTPFRGPGELAVRATRPWRRFSDRFGQVDGARASPPGLTVVSLNTARAAQWRLNWSKGAVSPRQVRRLRAELRAAPAADVRIVVCHHPLVEVLGGPMTARVRGGTTTAAAIAEAGADLVLSGHIHRPFVAPLPFGDGRTHAVGSGTLSRRERDAPPSFNLIDLDGRAARVTALGFQHGDFAPWRAWAVDLRP